MSSDVQAPWVIVMAEPGADERVERALWASGYRVYLPRFRRLLRHAGATQTPLRPAMPGYLFVADWHGWPATPIAGISGLMRRPDTNKPHMLDDADVQILWDAERTGAWDEIEAGCGRPRRRTDLKLGDNVVLRLHGERLRGVIERLSDAGKAIIKDIVTAMGHSVLIRSMEVDADELDKATS